MSIDAGAAKTMLQKTGVIISFICQVKCDGKKQKTARLRTAEDGLQQRVLEELGANVLVIEPPDDPVPRWFNKNRSIF